MKEKLPTITLKDFGKNISETLKDSLKYQALGIAISGVICLGYNAYAHYQNGKEGGEEA